MFSEPLRITTERIAVSIVGQVRETCQLSSESTGSSGGERFTAISPAGAIPDRREMD